MKKREFMKLCRACVDKKQSVMSGEKIRQVPKSVRVEMVDFLVSRRQPIVRDIMGGFTISEVRSLEPLGYMYWYKTNGFFLLGNSEWKIELRVGM